MVTIRHDNMTIILHYNLLIIFFISKLSYDHEEVNKQIILLCKLSAARAANPSS